MIPFLHDDPRTWPVRIPIIAHDVGGSRDHSTAVVGGLCPSGPPLIGLTEFEELPQGLYGGLRAAALADIDARYNRNAVIIADLSNDRSYADALYETFGRRVIGVQISRHGDGRDVHWLQTKDGRMPIYTVGRTDLLEAFHSELCAEMVRFFPGPMAQRAYAQLADLELELRDTGMIYKCPAGKHDDLAMSCAMVGWAARHPHLRSWFQYVEEIRRPHPPRPRISSLAWT